MLSVKLWLLTLTPNFEKEEKGRRTRTTTKTRTEAAAAGLSKVEPQAATSG